MDKPFEAIADLLLPLATVACLVLYLWKPSDVSAAALALMAAAVLAQAWLRQRGQDFKADLSALTARVDAAESDARKAKEMAAGAYDAKRKPGF